MRLLDVVENDTEVQLWKQTLRALLADESGQDLVEYALVVGVIALGSIATLNSVATTLVGVFTTLTTTLNSAV